MDNTLFSLKSKKHKNPHLVTEIDPDASSRQQKKIHNDDFEDENRFLQCVWSLIRSGNLQEAQLLCRQCKLFWRSASIGSLEFFDSSLNESLSERKSFMDVDSSTVNPDNLIFGSIIKDTQLYYDPQLGMRFVVIANFNSWRSRYWFRDRRCRSLRSKTSVSLFHTRK
jgi:hypothetical protein